MMAVARQMVSGHPAPQSTAATGSAAISRARMLIYVIGFLVAGLCFWHVTSTEPSASLSMIRLTEWYGFIAAACLFLALLVSPVCAAIPARPGLGLLQGARRAIGVCACAFAALHTGIGFLGLLGGWNGLSLLGPARLADVLLSLIALIILCALTLTSSNRAQALMGVHWHRLHRLIYLAGGLTLLHMVAVGSHFLKWTLPAFTVAGLVLVLLILEWLRFSRNRADHHER